MPPSGNNGGGPSALTIAVLGAVVAGVFALLVPFVEHALDSGSAARSDPPPSGSLTAPTTLTEPTAPAAPRTSPGPSGPGGTVPPNAAGPADGGDQGSGAPALVEPVYLSSITPPSNDISPNGFNGYGVAQSVALKCNNPFAGESDRQVQYSLRGMPKTRLTGALGVMAIPSDLVATMRMKIYFDSRLVLSKTVSSTEEPIPFALELGNAQNVTLEVQCDSADDHRGVFVQAALS